MAWNYTKWYRATKREQINNAKREARDKQRPLLIAWSKLSGCINCTMFRRYVSCDGHLGHVPEQCKVQALGHPICSYADSNKIVMLEVEISSCVTYGGSFKKYYNGYGSGRQGILWNAFPTIFMVHVKEDADCDTKDNYTLVRDTEMIFCTQGIGGNPVYGSLGQVSSLKCPRLDMDAFTGFTNMVSAVFSGEYPEFNTYGMKIGQATPDISTLIGSERRLTFKEKRIQCLLSDETVSIPISQIHQSSNYEGGKAVQFTFDVSIEHSEIPNVHFGESVSQKSITVSASTDETTHSVVLKLPLESSIPDDWDTSKEVILKLKNTSLNFVETDKTTLSLNVYKHPLKPIFTTDTSESVSISNETTLFDVIMPNNSVELLWGCVTGSVPSHITIDTSYTDTTGKLIITSSNTTKDFNIFGIKIYARLGDTNNIVEGDTIKLRAPTGL